MGGRRYVDCGVGICFEVSLAISCWRKTHDTDIKSSSRTVSDIGFSMGWKPVKTDQDFKMHFLEEARLVVVNPTPRSW